MYKGVFYDNDHIYVAVLDNGSFIIAYEDGTAIDLYGNRYRHVCRYDEDENIISDGWKPETKKI